MIAFSQTPRAQWARYNSIIAERLKEDLVEADAGDPLDDFYQNRCPEWPLLQYRERCVRALDELRLMATDGYEHELIPFYESILHRCLLSWLATERDVPQKKDVRVIEQLDHMIDVLFEDRDFLMVERMAMDVLRRGELVGRLRIRVSDHLDLMPDDIRARVEAILGQESGLAAGGIE